MIRVFSGSCLSLDEVDHVREVTFVERPHLLGPGVDYFTQDGLPLRPLLSSHTLNKVFSGSALDLNDLGGETDESIAAANAAANNASGANGSAAASGSADGTSSGRGVDPTVSSILAGLHAAATSANEGDPAKAKTSVLVVGAGGYVGSYICRTFLEAGYSVRAAVEDISDVKLNNELYSLHPEAAHRLTIVGLNVLDASAFRDHVRGAKFVIHCGLSASHSRETNGKASLKAHTEATQAFFDAVRTYGKATVRRVVVIGSASAFASGAPAGAVIDESILRKAAKAATEPAPLARISFVNESIRLAKMVGIELTVLLPTIMIGPSLVRESSEGMRTISDLSNGPATFPFAPRMCWNYVDVRDVAAASLRATEADSAKNEIFILANATLSLSQVGRLIRKAHPHLTAPIYDAPTLLTMTLAPLTNAKVSIRYLWRSLGVARKFDSSKAKAALGLEYTDIATTVADSVTELIQHNHVPATAGAKATAAYSSVTAGASADGSGASSASCSAVKKAAVAIAVVGAAGAAASIFLKMKQRK